MVEVESATKTSEEIELDRPTSRLICIYHALSHPVRFTICKHLLQRPHTVGELLEILDMKQYAVSQQLAVLRNSDIVETERQSRNIIYSLRSDAVRRILRVSMRNTGVEFEHENNDQKSTASGFARVG